MPDVLGDFVEAVVSETGAYPVIAFGSGLHGSGRSYLARMVYEKFRNAGVPVDKVSVGEIFRRLAEEHGITIGEFAGLQAEDPEKFYALNVSVDKKIHELVQEKSQNSAVVVDSNLAAYHACTPNTYAILVYARPEIVGERVYRARRKAENSFKSPADALKHMILRTQNDIRLYRELSSIARDNFWKMVYRIAAKDMGKNLETILGGKIPKSPFFHGTVDNSGPPEKSWEDVERLIKAQLER